MNQSRARVGFTYQVAVRKPDGRLEQQETVHNVVPDVALDYILGILLKNSAVHAAWYIAIYEGTYTPDGDETMATLPTDATECTAYDEATRVAFTPGTVSGGAVDNQDSTAAFTMSAAKTVRGAYITNIAAKSSTSGIPLSVVQFASAKTLADGDELDIVAGFTISNAE